MSQTGQEAILDSLRRTVEGLRWQPSGHWVQYGRQTSYSEAGAASKREHVERMLAASGARTGLGPGRQRRHLLDHRGG